MKLLNRRLPVVFAICYTSYSVVYIVRLNMTMGISPLIEIGFLTKTTIYVIAIPLTGLFGRLLFMPLYKLCRRDLTLTTTISFGICMLTGVAV